MNEGCKAIDNYEYAYNTQNIDLLAVTQDSEFLHHFLEQDRDDYNGDGIVDSTWDNLELSMASGYFSEFEYCEFALEARKRVYGMLIPLVNPWHIPDFIS